MDIYIHKDVLGFDQHLIYQGETGKTLKTSDIPDDAPIVYGDPSLLEIAKLYGITLPAFPPPAQVRALQAVLGVKDITMVPWQHSIPPGILRRSIEELGRELVRLFSGLDLSYYLNHYQKTAIVFKKLKRAKIDSRAWKIHSEDKELVTPHVFWTFDPDEDWYAREIVFSRCDTKTGRMKVVEGPNLLHLPKEQRNILTSRFGSSGKIWSLDYSSVEPRLVLFLKDDKLSHPPYGSVPLINLMGPQSQGIVDSDIYTSVLTALRITTIPRDMVKVVVLSQLYGAGHDTILGKLEGIRDPNGFIEAVNDYFGLNVIRKRLLKEYEDNDRQFIHSFYGRKLDTRDAKPYMLLNYYIQSTAVDVAMYGFRAMIRHIRDPRIIPLGPIHDAMVLDVHNDLQYKLEELCAVGSRDIPLFPGKVFPLKASRF